MHVENLTFGYQAFNEQSGDKIIVGYIFVMWNENWGQWVKFWDIGQNMKILVKKTRLIFNQTFQIFVNMFFENKYKNCFEIFNLLNSVSNISSVYENRTSGNKDILN